MTLEYYRSFIAIVECGTILAAAEKRHIAQPALSNQLKTMEREYNAQLVERGARGIALTGAGRILYQKAKSIVALEDAAQREIQDQLKGMRGTLALALPPTSSQPMLEQLLGTFLERYPGVRLELYELNSGEVARYVLEGRAELGLIRAPIQNPLYFDLYPLDSEPIAAFLPQGHPMAKQAAVQIEQLKGMELAVPRGCMEPVRQACARYHFEPELAFVTTSRTVAMDCARLKGCAALVPFGAGDSAQVQALRMCPLEPDPPSVSRALLWKKGASLSLPARNFLECCPGGV